MELGLTMVTRPTWEETALGGIRGTTRVTICVTTRVTICVTICVTIRVTIRVTTRVTIRVTTSSLFLTLLTKIKMLMTRMQHQ